MHILLADKQPRVRSAMRLLLEERLSEIIVEEATNVQELLEHLENGHPDVLILDWALPGPVPENLLNKLLVSRTDLFTIVLDSRPQTKQVAIGAGANLFVSKNDPPESLLAAVNNFSSSNKRTVRIKADEFR